VVTQSNSFIGFPFHWVHWMFFVCAHVHRKILITHAKNIYCGLKAFMYPLFTTEFCIVLLKNVCENWNEIIVIRLWKKCWMAVIFRYILLKFYYSFEWVLKHIETVRVVYHDFPCFLMEHQISNMFIFAFFQ
jgi:hypothetical protein